MRLFEPDRHEPLTATPWHEAAARAAVGRIAADAHAAFTPEGLWPIHPSDVSPERPDVLKPIYYGAAGVIWALHALHGAGLADVGRDYLPAVAALLESQRADYRQLGRPSPLGYPIGEAGMLLLHWKLAPSDVVARELYAAIDANREHPALGFVWGGAGSMLAALFMFEWTGDERWSALYLRSFDELWKRLAYDGRHGCHLWTIDLYGTREQHIGALHGLPGIVACMLRGRALAAPDRASELVRRACQTVHNTALRDGPHANWPLVLGELAPGSGKHRLLLQHCWGAPGIVNCLCSLPRDPDTDGLFRAAGDLIWSAGPGSKLPSLCHGVPSAGYAFLKLFGRTGDEHWLARARAFAMHGIEQAERLRAQHGQRKFSLWTGDLGLAMFIADCIRATSAFPTLDVF